MGARTNHVSTPGSKAVFREWRICLSQAQAAQLPGEANREQNLLESRILKSQAAILAVPSAHQGKPTSTSALDGNIYKHGMGRGR